MSETTKNVIYYAAMIAVPVLNVLVGGNVWTFALCGLVWAFVSWDAQKDMDALRKLVISSLGRAKLILDKQADIAKKQ